MRKLYLTENDPPTEADVAAAAAAGAVEIVHGGIPPALIAEGITTFGYHEITEPTPVPEAVEKRKLKLEMLATPWPPSAPTGTLLDAVNGFIASGSAELQIEWSDANDISRSRDLVMSAKAALQASVGLTEAQGDALMDQLFRNADARP